MVSRVIKINKSSAKSSAQRNSSQFLLSRTLGEKCSTSGVVLGVASGKCYTSSFIVSTAGAYRRQKCRLRRELYRATVWLRRRRHHVQLIQFATTKTTSDYKQTDWRFENRSSESSNNDMIPRSCIPSYGT